MVKILIIIEGPILSGKSTIARKIREEHKYVQLFSPSGLKSFSKMNKVHIEYLQMLNKVKQKNDEQIYVLERSLFTNYIYFNNYLNTVKEGISKKEYNKMVKIFDKDFYKYIDLLFKLTKKFNKIHYVSLQIDKDDIERRVKIANETKHDFVRYSKAEVEKQIFNYNLLDDFLERLFIKGDRKIQIIKTNNYTIDEFI